jgi:hypothetical protein
MPFGTLHQWVLFVRASYAQLRQPASGSHNGWPHLADSFSPRSCSIYMVQLLAGTSQFRPLVQRISVRLFHREDRWLEPRLRLCQRGGLRAAELCFDGFYSARVFQLGLLTVTWFLPSQSGQLLLALTCPEMARGERCPTRTT